MQEFAVALTKHRPSTRGQHPVARAGDQICDDFGFKLPEGVLTVALKKLLDAAAYPLLDFVIRIQKASAHPPCQSTPDGRLARAHQANEIDVSSLNIHSEILARNSESRPERLSKTARAFATGRSGRAKTDYLLAV